MFTFMFFMLQVNTCRPEFGISTPIPFFSYRLLLCLVLVLLLIKQLAGLLPKSPKNFFRELDLILYNSWEWLWLQRLEWRFSLLLSLFCLAEFWYLILGASSSMDLTCDFGWLMDEEMVGCMYLKKLGLFLRIYLFYLGFFIITLMILNILSPR